jgi:bifunctional non-homologous end joining protein LigD
LPQRIIPADRNEALVDVAGRRVKLTNLRKPFWPNITKGDLLQYYLDVAPALLPHIRDRPMVMKRYPHGAAGEFFFMKRTPTPRPDWIEICSVEHQSGKVIDFALIQDLAALLWVVNLGCIDLNPWYARCDAVELPDFLHFDLDPGDAARFELVKESAFHLRELLSSLGMPAYVKTTGSRGLHVYVPIGRGPTQHEVWAVAKTLSSQLAARHPRLMTTVYKVADRPRDRVHVDFNQNALGRTLASIYSVRPRPLATVSTPVSWRELETVAMEDFRIDNMPARVADLGDLWAPLLADEGRFDLGALIAGARAAPPAGRGPGRRPT